DSPTDVLAFAMNEGEAAHVQAHILGDIVISLSTARRQAAEHGRTIASEVRWLLAHGLLHLLGFDHQNTGDYRRMMARQDVLVWAQTL
ncbi:MAG: putative rRNA maturation factor, partial [Polyangiales bacterium]